MILCVFVKEAIRRWADCYQVSTRDRNVGRDKQHQLFKNVRIQEQCILKREWMYLFHCVIWSSTGARGGGWIYDIRWILYPDAGWREQITTNSFPWIMCEHYHTQIDVYCHKNSRAYVYILSIPCTLFFKTCSHTTPSIVVCLISNIWFLPTVPHPVIDLIID